MKEKNKYYTNTADTRKKKKQQTIETLIISIETKNQNNNMKLEKQHHGNTYKKYTKKN